MKLQGQVGADFLSPVAQQSAKLTGEDVRIEQQFAINSCIGGKPYLETLQVATLEFVEDAADNTLSVGAYGSGGRKQRNQPNRVAGVIELFPESVLI